MGPSDQRNTDQNTWNAKRGHHLRDERDNMLDSLLYQVHQIGMVVYGYGLQLLKYLIPGADNDHQDEGYQEILLASSTPTAVVIRRRGRGSCPRQGRGRTVVGHLMEELSSLPPSSFSLSSSNSSQSLPQAQEEDAQVVAVAALPATLASLDNNNDCSNSNLRLSGGIIGRQGNFFALISLSSSSIPMAAVGSDGGRRLTVAGGNDGDSGRRQRAGTMAAVDGGDGRRRRPQQFTPLLIVLLSIVALSRQS